MDDCLVGKSFQFCKMTSFGNGSGCCYEYTLSLNYVLKMVKLVTYVYFITIKKLGKQNKKTKTADSKHRALSAFYMATPVRAYRAPCKGL